jgi:hypothetical protein
MKLVGDAFHLPNLQHQLHYTSRLLVGQGYTQVKAYITDEGIILVHVPAVMMVLETAFGDQDCVAMA